MKSFFHILCVGVAMSSFAAPFDAPLVDIDYQKNLRLWRAQKSILTAFENIELSQRESPERFGNHARQAEELLVQAAKELKAASAQLEGH